jgi:hypothetical protein
MKDKAKKIQKEAIKLFETITSKPSFLDESGRITRFNRDWIMIDLKYFPYKLNEVMTDIAGAEVATDCVFRFGKECGKEMYRRYVGIGKKGEDAIKTTAAGSTYFGWGPCEIVELTPEKAVGKIYNSFEGRSYLSNNSEKSDKPVCHFLRGVMTGLFEEFTGEKSKAEEKKCLSKGDEYCEFIITKKDY